MSDSLHGTLLDSEERYRSVIAAMAEGVMLQDANAAIIACNASAERMLGLTADQMAGRTSLDPRWQSIHSDGSPFPGETHPAVEALRSGRRQRDVEMGVHRPDGSLTWISINAEPLLRPGDAKPYAVVSTFSDITARKRAELELRRSEERYRRIVETSVEGIWAIDLEGRTNFANARMARILRCTPEELARSSLLDFIAPSEHASVQERLQGRARGEDEEHEFCFVAKDGSHVWTSIAACAFVLPDGTPGALAMARDITEQKQLLSELQEARRLEAVGRLAGGVAHDFNNLLTAILNSVTLIESFPAEVSEHLETIRSAGERAAGLTRQLLAFARKQIIRARPLSLNQVVRELSGVLQRVVTERIELVMELTPDIWPVLGDPGQLEQVLVNLVANARDAMPEGGRVVISTRQVTLEPADLPNHPDAKPGEYVVLSVRDTGEGMDETARARLFEPFFTTKNHGTGLGLASCYGIVKQLGGHIWVSPARAGGTTFDVYLARTEERPSAETRELAAPSGGHETVLIAEDDRSVRETLARALTAAGYVVLAAQDGEQALELAAVHSGTIALLITDVVMPKLGGHQLAERLKALRPDVPVLFVSGYYDQIELPERMFGSPLQFLSKPYTYESILRSVRALLDRPRST